MREIKFRAFFKGYRSDPDFNEEKYNRSKKMVYDIQDLYDGSGTTDSNIAGGYTHFGEIIESDDFVVMQFTGLKDKNGKDIYEGDIIRWHDVVTSDYTVTFTDGVFCIDEMPDSNFWHHREEISKKWEVIGNIYENKDLLK